jgi:hypothetical protein
MAWVQKDFDTYKLWHASGNSPVTGAAIECFKMGSRVGTLYFYKDDIALPPNDNDPTFGIRLYLPLTRFGDIINTVRYEKPLYLMFESVSQQGWFTTSDTEPVGEEE